MGSIASITKKLGVGTISTLSSMAGIGKLIVSSLGDIQAVSASAGTLAGLVLFLNSLPMWFVVGSFALSTGYLIWSAIQDDLTRSRAITEAKDANERGMAEVKKANTRAWEFEPEFRDAMMNIATDRGNFNRAVNEIREIQVIYQNAMATAVKDVSDSFEARCEFIAKSVLEQHFAGQQNERSVQESQRVRYQGVQIHDTLARVIDLTARLDALPQPPQGTESETPP